MKRNHVFISHHSADDAKVDQLTSLLNKAGRDVRNSSVRLGPANQRRMDQGLVRDETIRRLLRLKISWASTVVVLIGNNTHERPWVNWEITEAARQGKRVVGVYAYRGTDAQRPPALDEYGSTIVAWNTDSIVDAIDDKANTFQNSDGTTREAVHANTTTVC